MKKGGGILKKIILALVLILCLAVLSCRSAKPPLPDGIRMGMSAEEAAEITGGEIRGSSIFTEDGIYTFGSSGLVWIIVQENS